jgi:ectoine hydroxylase-related dioxygenase (phytanoyl-CoA dioxygenase family)
VDPSCLDFCLTEDERREFDELGFFIVRQALPSDRVRALVAAVDRVDAIHRPKMKLDAHGKLNVLDFIGKEDVFLELLDWPKTFPKVWGILGWHIQLYHSHMIVTPPLGAGEEAPKRLLWHQDSGRINIDIETDPRPRVSLKIGFFLTDVSTPDRGNFHVIPGSHLTNRLALPEDENLDHPDVMPVCVSAGDAVFFDRRLWHSAGNNLSDVTRKVLFYGYSYRWLKPRDNMTVAHYMERCDPVRRQLLGASPTGGFGFTSPSDDDVPLKAWIREHQGEGAVVR